MSNEFSLMTMQPWIEAPVEAKPIVRETTFDDYEAIAALERSCGSRPRSKDEWKSTWTSNPAYREVEMFWPLGWLLEDPATGHVYASLSNIPLPYAFEGRTVTAATPANWLLDPEYAAYAPLLQDEFRNQNVDLLLTSAQASPRWMGLTPVPARKRDQVQAAYAITSYPGFAEAALRLRGAAAPELLWHVASPALWLRDKVTGPRVPRSVGGVEVECSKSFDSGFDVFWADLQASRQGQLMAVRNREVLEWTFGAALQKGTLRVLTVDCEGQRIAHAVLVRSDHAASGLRRMRIVDYQSLSNDPRVVEAILHRAFALCKGTGIHALEIDDNGSPERQEFIRAMPHTRPVRAVISGSQFYATDRTLMDTLSASVDAWEPWLFGGAGAISQNLL